MVSPVSAAQFPNPKDEPAKFEAAMEAFALRVELETCEVVEKFRTVLNKLPLSAAFLKSPEWRGIVSDPLLAENRSRMQDIKTRLSELEDAAK